MRPWKHRVALLVILASTSAWAAGDGSEPARALPPQVIVCLDRNGHRCWSAASEAECRSVDGGEVFRTLERGDGSVGHGSALSECWRSAAGRPAD